MDFMTCRCGMLKTSNFGLLLLTYVVSSTETIGQLIKGRTFVLMGNNKLRERVWMYAYRWWWSHIAFDLWYYVRWFVPFSIRPACHEILANECYSKTLIKLRGKNPVIFNMNQTKHNQLSQQYEENNFHSTYPHNFLDNWCKVGKETFWQMQI